MANIFPPNNEYKSALGTEIRTKVVKFQNLLTALKALETQYNTDQASFKNYSSQIKADTDLNQLRSLGTTSLTVEQKVLFNRILKSIDDPIADTVHYAIDKKRVTLNGHLQSVAASISDAENVLKNVSEPNLDLLKTWDTQINEVERAKAGLEADVQTVTDAKTKAEKALGNIALLKKYKSVIEGVHQLENFKTRIATLEQEHTINSNAFNTQEREFTDDVDVNRASYADSNLTDGQKALHKQILQSITDSFNATRQNLNTAETTLIDNRQNLTTTLTSVETQLNSYNDTLPNDAELNQVYNWIDKVEKKISTDLNTVEARLDTSAETQKVNANIALLKRYDGICEKIKNLKILQKDIQDFQTKYTTASNEFDTSKNDIGNSADIIAIRKYAASISSENTQKTLFDRIIKSIDDSIDAKVQDVMAQAMQVLQDNLQNVNDNISQADNTLHASFDITTESLETLDSQINKVNVASTRTALKAQVQTVTNAKTKAAEAFGNIALLKKYKSVIDGVNKLKKLHNDILTLQVNHNKFSAYKNQVGTDLKFEEIRQKLKWSAISLPAEQLAVYQRILKNIDGALNPDVQKTVKKIGTALSNQNRAVTEKLADVESELDTFFNNNNIPSDNDLTRLSATIDSVSDNQIRVDLSEESMLSGTYIKGAEKAIDDMQLIKKYDTIVQGITTLKDLKITIKRLQAADDENYNAFLNSKSLIDAKLVSILEYANSPNLKPEQQKLYRLMLQSIERSIGSNAQDAVDGARSPLQTELTYVEQLIGDAEKGLRTWSTMDDSELGPDIDRVSKLLYDIQPQQQNNNALPASMLKSVSNNDVNSLKRHLDTLQSKATEATTRAGNAAENFTILNKLLEEMPYNPDSDSYDWRALKSLIRANLLHHLIGTPGHPAFNSKNRISGTHSWSNFYELIQNSFYETYSDAKFFYHIEKTQFDANGIDTVIYSRREYDQTYIDPINQDLNGWRPIFYKTKSVYDPGILSDLYIQYYGLQAAMQADRDASLHNNENFKTASYYTIENIEYGGIHFTVGFTNKFDANNNFLARQVDTVFPVRRLADGTYNETKFVSKLVSKQQARYVASIYNGMKDADAQEHKKLVSNILEAGTQASKTAFWEGYNNYEGVEILGYRSDLDKTLSDLYYLTYEKQNAQQLGALTRRIEEAKSDPVSQLRAEHDYAFMHSYKIAEKYFKIAYSNHYILSQRLLSPDSKIGKEGYCYALSRSMALVLADGGIAKGKQFLKKDLYQAIEQDRISGKNQTKDMLSGWNDWANKQHTARARANGLPPLQTLDEIKHQLSSAKETTLYELNTSKHAMVIGILVDNSKRQYVFYDPEHGLIELDNSNKLNEFFTDLKYFLGDTERSAVYGVSKDAANTLKFEFIPIDTTDDTVKNMWALAPNKSHVAYSLDWQPDWISNFNNENNPNNYSIEKGKSLLDAINKGSVLTQADMLAVFAGGGKGQNRVVVVDSKKEQLANLQYVLYLAQNNNYKTWLEKVSNLYSSSNTEVLNLFDQIPNKAVWFKQLKTRIKKDGFVFIHADLTKPSEGINIRAYLGSDPISTVHNLHNSNSVATPMNFLNNMAYLYNQEIQFTYAADGQIIPLNEGIDRIIKSHQGNEQVFELMSKHGISDPILQLKSNSDQLDKLVVKQNDIREQVQKLDSQLTKDHILVYDAIEHKTNGDIVARFVHSSGQEDSTLSVDISKSSHHDLVSDIHKVHKGYKKLASQNRWVNSIDKLDDTIGYIGLVNQYRALIQGELLHPNATLEHQLIGYGQFALGTTQTGAQVTTKGLQYLNKMASNSSKAATFAKAASVVGKAGKALPVIGVVLEGGSFALSVNDLTEVLNDPHASDLQKHQAISNVVLGGSGLTVSVITVGAMFAGATVVAGAATGVGLLLIPIGMGVNTYFEIANIGASVEQMSKYMGDLTRAYRLGLEHKQGALQFAYGAIVKKIDLKNKYADFGTQSVSRVDIFQNVVKKFDGDVSVLVLPTTTNQQLEYTYETHTSSDYKDDWFLKNRATDQDGNNTINELSRRGLPVTQRGESISIPIGGESTLEKTEIRFISGLNSKEYTETSIEILLDKQVKNLYTPTLPDKSAHNKLTYALQGDGGQYTLTLADKVKFTLSENTNSSSTWILDSSNMVEKDDIQIQSSKLIIGGVEIDVSRLSATSKLIIQRQNGDSCTIDLSTQTKTLSQMSGHEYEKRKNDLSTDGYTLGKGDQYMLIKNYQHNGQNVGNAYYNIREQQIVFSIPVTDPRQGAAIPVMDLLDKLMKYSTLYEIEASHNLGTSTTYTPTGSYMGTGSESRSTTESGYNFELKECKGTEIAELRTSIANENFRASHPSLYEDIQKWLSNYDDNTKQIRKQISAQSKKWESNVKVTAISKTILNENSFIKQVDWNALGAVSLIKQQQNTLRSLYEQIQQKLNPLHNAVLGGVDGNDRYFFNIQKGLAWQTDTKGVIKKQYTPLPISDWDYKHLSFRQATNADGKKLFLLDIIAHSRTGTRPVSRSLTYQLSTDSMDLLVDHTDLSTHTHPSASELGQQRTFKFSNVPQVQWKESTSYVHYYDENVSGRNYWERNGQRIYADLPSDVNIQARKSMSMDSVRISDQLELFYFYDKKNQKLYQQEGYGTTRDLTNPKAKLIGTTDQKIINTYVNNGFAYATDERGVTYQVEHNGNLDTIAWVTLNPAWLSANGNKDWITWLKSDLFKNFTDNTHQIRIHGLKSYTADGETSAWYQNNKLTVVDLGKNSFIGLDHTGTQAYLFNETTGKLYQQATYELSNTNNDLSADGYTLKNNITNTELLPTWTFSKATVLDWKEFVDNNEVVNKILSLEIKKEANDHGSLSLLLDVKTNKKTLTITHPADITQHASLVDEVDALILSAPDGRAYTYNLDALLTNAGKIKLITINYQNTRSDKAIFDQLQYSATSNTKFGQLGNDLYITDDRGTIQLQDVFTSDTQTVYKQLKFQIAKADSTTFSKSVWEVAEQLKDTEELSSSIDFYQLSDFVNTGQLIYQEKNHTKDIFGSINDDNLVGNELANSIYGLQGNDTLNGGDHNDILHGGSGDDSLYGDMGNDELYGQEDNDNLYGGEGRDVLYGGIGNDQIWGGDNDDELYGEEGNDKLHGGRGDDFYVFTADHGHDIIVDDHGIDVIYFSQANQNNTYIFERLANDLIIDYGNQDKVTVSDHFDPNQQDKSIEGIEFQNNGMIDLEKASTWVWSLSDKSTFKKDGHDLWISDKGTTFVLKNVFSASNLSACTQLGLQIAGLKKYRTSFLAIETALNQACTQPNNTTHHWYKWADFLKEGVLINLTAEGDINHAIGITNKATIIGDQFANTLCSNGDNSVLSGKQGNDKLYGGTRSDTYLFHGDDGADTIVDSGGTDTLEFASGVDVKKLERNGQDLIIHHGNTSSIRVKDHFNSSDQSVEYLKLPNKKTYQITVLVQQAEINSVDKENWNYNMNELTAGYSPTTQVDVENPSPINATDDTLNFSTWKGPTTPDKTKADLLVDLKKQLWGLLNNPKKEAIAASIKNITGSAHNEHFIGNDHDNVIYGGGGRDVFEGGKGKDKFTDGTHTTHETDGTHTTHEQKQHGDSTYVFTNTDGQDEIWDWGGLDTIQLAQFSIPNPKSGRPKNLTPTLTFHKNENDLLIKNNGDTNSFIRIHDHFIAGRGIEYLEWGGTNNRFNLSSLTNSLVDNQSSYTITSLE